jgi:hypothetical protein
VPSLAGVPARLACRPAAVPKQGPCKGARAERMRRTASRAGVSFRPMARSVAGRPWDHERATRASHPHCWRESMKATTRYLWVLGLLGIAAAACARKDAQDPSQQQPVGYDQYGNPIYGRSRATGSRSRATGSRSPRLPRPRRIRWRCRARATSPVAPTSATCRRAAAHSRAPRCRTAPRAWAA